MPPLLDRGIRTLGSMIQPGQFSGKKKIISLFEVLLLFKNNNIIMKNSENFKIISLQFLNYLGPHK